MSIFTKIISKEIKSDILYEDDKIIVIKDIYPKAKTHLLIIPKKEIPTINDLTLEDTDLISNMFFVAKKVAIELNIDKWYKLLINVWKEWWQEIMHIHMHLLSNL